jgi:hypothetical protein
VTAVIKTLRHLVPLAAALFLAACAGVTAASGTWSVGRAYSIQLERTWSDTSTLVSPNAQHVKVLTLDGWTLNQLIATDGLPVGQSMVSRVSASKRRTDDKQVPIVRAGMGELELVEFVADSMAFWDFQRIETGNVMPARFGPHEGVSFDIDAQTVNGLDMRAKALAAQSGDKVYVLLFIAPGEHYFPAMEQEVGRILASVRFP